MYMYNNCMFIHLDIVHQLVTCTYIHYIAVVDEIDQALASTEDNVDVAARVSNMYHHELIEPLQW